MTAARHLLACFLGLAVALLVAVAPPALAAEFDDLMQQGLTARNAGDFAAAETAFAKALEHRPEDATAVLYLGLVQGYQGRHAEALATIERGLAMHPKDFDLRLTVARIKGWMGRDAEAEADVDALLQDFPENTEALNLKGRLALYRGDAAAAETAYSHVLRLDPGNETALKGMADTVASRTVRVDGGPGSRLAVTYSRSSFSRRDQADWNEMEADLVIDIDEYMRFLGKVQMSHRFGATDIYLRGGLEHRFTPDVAVRVQLGVTPDAGFLARWTAEAGVTVRVSDGVGFLGPTEILADVKHSHYATGDVRTVDPGIRQYLGGGRIWLTGRWLNTFDAEAGNKRMKGWSLRGDWQMADWMRVFGGWADAPETDRGNTVSTMTSFGGLVIDMTQDSDLTFAYTHDNRKNTYIRDVVSATVGYRF